MLGKRSEQPKHRTSRAAPGMWQQPPHPFLFALWPHTALFLFALWPLTAPAIAMSIQETCGSFALALAGSPWQQGDREQLKGLHQLPSNGTQIWELLPLALTCSRVSASCPVKGNIYLCKKV